MPTSHQLILKTLLTLDNNVGLQDFMPIKNRYNLIWCQWVLGHLTAEHLVYFLKRSKAALKEGGYIGIKENIAKVNIEIDETDSSCTRTDIEFKRIFSLAGLKIVKEDVQRNFPAHLYVVKLYLLH